jgi:hypothetical protein
LLVFKILRIAVPSSWTGKVRTGYAEESRIDWGTDSDKEKETRNKKKRTSYLSFQPVLAMWVSYGLFVLLSRRTGRSLPALQAFFAFRRRPFARFLFRHLIAQEWNSLVPPSHPPLWSTVAQVVGAIPTK